MLYSDIFDNYSLIEINDAFPKHVLLVELRSSSITHHLLLVKTSDKWVTYENVVRSITDKELAQITNLFSQNGWNNITILTPSLFSADVPQYLSSFIEDVSNIPGAYIFPNLFEIDGNLYIQIYTTNSSRSTVGSKILEFIATEREKKCSLVYFGGTDHKNIKRVFDNINYNLYDEEFSSITTVWHFKRKEIEEENDGVFQNAGVFVPKFFVNSDTVTLIGKLEVDEVKGNGNYSFISAKRKLVELTLHSRFMQDFFETIINNYGGFILQKLWVTSNEIYTKFLVYHPIEKRFIKELYKHWSLPARVVHLNSLLEIRQTNFNEIVYDRPA